MRDLSHVMGLRNRIPLILERSKASGIDDPSNAPHLTRSRPTLGNLDVRYKVKSIVRVPVAQLRGQPIAKGDFFVMGKWVALGGALRPAVAHAGKFHNAGTQRRGTGRVGWWVLWVL